MLYGQDLKRAIDEMGLNVNQFAAKCVRANGKTVSPTAIWDLIRKSGIEAEDDTKKAIETALHKHCRTCGQYTEKKDAWNHSTPDRGKGSRQRQA